MNVAIVKYNAGNVFSVVNALKRLGAEPVVTDDAEVLSAAERVIFPGVGEASSAMGYLRSRGLDEVIKGLSRPVLGICLGMQLLGEYSEENGTACLDLIPFRVNKFQTPGLKVPHVGWNQVSGLKSPLFDRVSEKEHFYFVHGYYAETVNGTIASCDYGATFSAAVRAGNFYGVQFHPEKSGSAGETVLENFLRL